MTDHGGAASPRTEAGKWALANLGGYDGHFALCPAFRLGGECLCGPRIRAIEAEAAQEAPAPEGLPPNCVAVDREYFEVLRRFYETTAPEGLRDEWTDERRPEDDAECERLGCEDRTHPVHHRVRAEARPPEGLDWPEILLDALCASDNGNNPFYHDDEDAVILANELAAVVATRLSAGGATKP